MYNPQGYSRNIDPMVNVARKLFTKHSSLLRWNAEPESILDIGIGDGRMCKEVVIPLLPVVVKEYVGADISKEMLDCAEKTVNHDKFSTYKLDVATENLPDELKNRFHHIFATYLFHYVQNIRPAFRNIFDMLRPGGQFIFHAFAETPNDQAYEILDKGKWSKYDNYKAFSPFYKHDNPRKGYEELVESLGFVDCHVYIEGVSPLLTEKSFEELRAAVNIRLPFIEESDKEEYLKDFIAETKRCRNNKLVIDEQTGARFIEMSLNIVTGVISKPL